MAQFAKPENALGDDEMRRIVYIGNLPENVWRMHVENLFRECGLFSSGTKFQIWNDLKPPHYAFIVYDDASLAENAIAHLDGFMFMKHRLRVELACDCGSGRGGVCRRSKHRVVVTSLLATTMWQDLQAHMQRAGVVCFTEVISDMAGTSVIVDYRNSDGATNAVKKYVSGESISGTLVDKDLFKVRVTHLFMSTTWQLLETAGIVCLAQVLNDTRGEVFTDVVGSPYYVAPEVLRKRYGPKADVWSAGVIIYILLSGVPPFWDETEQGIFEQVLGGELDFISEPWPSISESAKDLIKKMLVRDSRKRLTAHEVLCHPWVQVDGIAPDKPLDPAVLTRLKQFSAMNKLKKMALRVIAESLSEDEIAGLKEMFKMIDTDNSGQITFEELKSGLERVGAILKDSEILSLMEAADIDNSGTIDYGEFLAATLHLNKVEREDNLFAAFSYFDKDGSGYITLDELQKACDEFGIKSAQLDEIIKEADQDNDGRIDYNEFAAMMQNGNVTVGKVQNSNTAGLRNALKIG